jgi:hypothetical protein
LLQREQSETATADHAQSNFRLHTVSVSRSLRACLPAKVRLQEEVRQTIVPAGNTAFPARGNT